MFPNDIESFLENEDVAIETDSTVFNGTSFLYDFTKGDFIYKNGAPVMVNGIEALRVWIEKIIRTEKFKFNVYQSVEGNSEYGVSIEDLIGSNLPQGFIESEMKRELTESITKNPYIDELTEWSFEREGSKLTINFTVVLSDETTFEMEVAA